jgi:glycogen debranching enzyme
MSFERDVAEARIQAIAVLRRCATPMGFAASGTTDGYPEIWARDAAVTAIGVAAAEVAELAPVARSSLATLAGHQSALGRIPTNVDPAGRATTANPGGVDGTLWFVIAQRVLDAAFGPDPVADDDARRTVLELALRWARYQDSDEDGLLESAEASNWADLLAYRGKVLSDNVLYVLALRAAAAMAVDRGLADLALHEGLAERAARALNELHWVDAPDGLWDRATSAAIRGDHLEARRLAQLTTSVLWRRPFYLPWVGFRSYGDWCDVLGNALAILAGVADSAKASMIVDYLIAIEATKPWPARAIDPPIRPGDADWREYYRNNGLNLPDQYHNGGCWPWIGGMLVCALVRSGRREEAAETLERLIRCVRTARPGGPVNEWEFTEWYHGRTGQPMGRPLQAWSAAMVLAACRAVETGGLPWLDSVLASG